MLQEAALILMQYSHHSHWPVLAVQPRALSQNGFQLMSLCELPWLAYPFMFSLSSFNGSHWIFISSYRGSVLHNPLASHLQSVIRLLLGRKAMINLDSIFKSRDITLPTKVHLVRLWFFLWSCMDVRVGLWRRLSTKELMLLNCGVGEDSWESLGLQGDPTSPIWRRSALGLLWREWC